MEYTEYLTTKDYDDIPTGLDIIPAMNPMLFEFQHDIVEWALKRGRAAIFADCGLGKTPMQLEWATHVPGNVLILAPLAVAQQTIREGMKFGIPVEYSRDGKPKGKITITNYEMLNHFDADDYAGIVLDESSILKSFGGVYRKEITAFGKRIPYRLACTATPAPNDLAELTNHAEFLDIMTGKQIIALFFIQDGNTTHKWRLKGHAREAFWRWMATWSVAMRAPSDLGYDDNGFKLPPLTLQDETIHVTTPTEGMLFAMDAITMDERRQARRESIEKRVQRAADIINGNPGPWIVWCNLNRESEMATKAIDGAVEVKGSDAVDHKEKTLLDFANGDVRCLVTKPTIAGHGMNFQRCSDVVFLGLSDSYEQFYQAVRRCWRFGQTKPVTAHIVTASTEGNVRANIARKEKQAAAMMANIVGHMQGLQLDKQGRNRMKYKTNDATGNGWTLMLGDAVERIKEIDDESIGLSVFSPPFPGMYAYTNSERDIGNCKDTATLIEHFRYLAPEILRITMPGRSCCIHLTQEPIFKYQAGYSGLRDFRGHVIIMMENCGWAYVSERTIDKDPQLKAARTKDHGLAMKTAAKDSSILTGTMPDYLLQFRKKGDNPKPIRALIDHQDPRKRNPDGWITREEWIQWASAVWYGHHRIGKGGIRESDVLSVRSSKDADDEKHLCPLQLGVIERCVKLWSGPGDVVFSPFAGIGSEGYQAVRFGRQFIGIELKETYWKVAQTNLKQAETAELELFKQAGVNP